MVGDVLSMALGDTCFDARADSFGSRAGTWRNVTPPINGEIRALLRRIL